MIIKFLQKNNKKIKPVQNFLFVLFLIFLGFTFNLKSVEAGITYEAKGAFASGTGALTVAVPAGYQDGDVFLLFIESANQTIATPSGGWTQVVNSPQYTGTAAAAGGVRLAVFYKIVSGAQSSVAVADSINHTTAIIANFRGVDTTSPIHLTSGSVDATARTAISTPTLTTTITDTMIVNAIGLDKDLADTDTITTAWVNANLTSPTERHDQTYAGGVGGGIAFATGIKATAGIVGNTTATADTSTTHAYITIALKPKLATLPTVTTTTPVTNITATTATGGGNVTSNGGATVSTSGLVWNTSIDPTIALSTKTTDGWADPGLWTSNMTGLAEGTLYYVRAYATNSVGTSYGNNVQFTTLVVPATITLSNFVSAEPGNFTIAPGSSAQVDSFGIVASKGTDTLTNAVVTMTTGMGQYVDNVALTNEGDTATYCNATPSGDTATFTGCTLPVTTTNTQFKVRLTAKSHALMPAPAGGAYAIGATVTSFTATGAEAGTDTGSSTLTIDNASPNGATSVSGTSGVNKNTINWTSSSSSDFHTTNGSVVLRWVGGSVGSGVPAEGNNSYAAGDAISSATVACVISSAVSTTISKIDGAGGSAGCTTTSLTNGQAYTYKVFQRDTNGNYDAGVLIGTFTPYGLPIVTTQAVTNIAGINATGNGNVMSDGGSAITERGVVWNASIDPTTSNSKASTSGTTGAFTASISGLTKNTQYYVRAYAINNAGTSYGDNVNFTTLIEPTVTTQAVTDITTTTATGNGNITSAGGDTVDTRGIVYDTTSHSSDPGNVAPASSLYPSKVEETGSFSEGAFSSGVTGLTEGTTYYVRAYSHNSIGYSYGGEVSFSTSSNVGGMPVSGTLTSSVFDTANSSSIGYNSIMWKGTLGGEGKVRFQFASSSSSSGPWNFYGGSTCSSGDWFDPLGPDTPIEIKEGSGCLGAWNNNRYFKYKVQLCSKDCVDVGTSTPTVDSIIVNWSL